MKKPWLIYRKSRDVLLRVVAEEMSQHVWWMVEVPTAQYPAISSCAFLPSPFEDGDESGIKSVNCTVLAVRRKSCLSGRIRTIYWPSVKIQRQD